MNTAGELRTCCASVGPKSRTHSKNKVLYHLFAMEALPVIRPCVWSGSIRRPHRYCLQGMKKPSPENSFPCCHPTAEKVSSEFFLSKLLLSRSLEVIRKAPVAHSSPIAGSARELFKAPVARSELRGFLQTAISLEGRLLVILRASGVFAAG